MKLEDDRTEEQKATHTLAIVARDKLPTIRTPPPATEPAPGARRQLLGIVAGPDAGNQDTMKTLKETIADNPQIAPTLIHAVAQSVGVDYLEDVARHGAAGGFPGITYHADTVAFFRRHRKAIVALVESQASEFGETPLDFVAGFQCLGGVDPKGRREYYPAVSRCLYGGRVDDSCTDVANALTWFAAEEVARAFNPDL